MISALAFDRKYDSPTAYPYVYPTFIYEKDGFIKTTYFHPELKCMGPNKEIPMNGKPLEENIELFYKNSIIQNEKLIEVFPGKFYPRIYRNGLIPFPNVIVKDEFNRVGKTSHLAQGFINNKIFEQSIVNANILLKKLMVLFETISPSKSNFDSYGAEIRNLLLLSCMEVESSFSGILKANDYKGGRWTTKDFVKILKPLYLNEYGIKFNLYSDIPLIKPFENWNATNPTTSLFWYDAYNITKHDRENYLNMATIKNVISGVSAVIILLHAQFGANHSFWREGEFINIKFEFDPIYNFEDYYIQDGKWEEMKFPF